MPVIGYWALTGLIAATFIFVMKSIVLSTGLKNVPVISHFAATV